MNNPTPENKSPIQFFLLVFALSVPFLIIGFIFKDITKSLPIKLPISALMTFCPLIAAAILVYKKRKIKGVGQLLKQAFDFEKIRDEKMKEMGMETNGGTSVKMIIQTEEH